MGYREGGDNAGQLQQPGTEIRPRAMASPAFAGAKARRYHQNQQEQDVIQADQ